MSPACFQRSSIAANLAETGGDHDDALDAFPAAFIHCLDCLFFGNDDDRQVNFVRYVQNAGIAFYGMDEAGAGINRKHRTVELVLDQVVQDFPADGSATAGGADDGN